MPIVHAVLSPALFASGCGTFAGQLYDSALGTCASVYNRHFNSTFVLAQYFGYLHRNPDDAPDSNLNGYQFWLVKLNQFKRLISKFAGPNRS